MPSAQLRSGQFYGTVARRREARGYVLSEVVHRAPRVFPKHAHARTYVSLLLGGSYDEDVGTRPVRHSVLGVSVRAAGTVHRDRVGSAGGRFFMLEIPAVPDGFGRALADPVMTRDPEPLFLLLRLYREFTAWDTDSVAIGEQLGAALISALARSRLPGGSAPRWLRRVHEMVIDRYRENVSLAELGAASGMNPAYVSHAFTMKYGRSPGELARALRVRHVCHALSRGASELSALAYESGFSDQSHMTRVVAGCVGVAPGSLRRLLQQPGARSR